MIARDQTEAEVDQMQVDPDQVASDVDQFADTDLTLADLEQYISGIVGEQAFDAAQARNDATAARDRAAEARERRAVESGTMNEALLALRALRISGAFTRQQAAFVRSAAEADRAEAAAFWRIVAAQRRDKL